MGITIDEVNDTIETILIGTGGGYGESIIVHLGNDEWIVVDSCINPHTRVSLPLEYLREVNVDIQTAVKLIVCTHWHDDHILGISQLLKEAKSSIFSIPYTSDRKKFLQLVGLDFNKIHNEATASSTKELNKCLSILAERNGHIKLACADKVLLSKKNEYIEYNVSALSPSDFVIEEFSREISTLISEYGSPNRRIIYNSPNDKSVVLYIKINEHCILLGSDLEVSKDKRKGWQCILDNCQIDLAEKSDIFKIPHHGSKNSYHRDVWELLVKEEAIAMLTPWNKGSYLPQTKMLEIFQKHTDNLYITSVDTTKAKQKKRSKDIEKAINRFKPSLQEIKFSKGIIRCFCQLNKKNWQVNLSGKAVKVGSFL